MSQTSYGIRDPRNSLEYNPPIFLILLVPKTLLYPQTLLPSSISLTTIPPFIFINTTTLISIKFTSSFMPFQQDMILQDSLTEPVPVPLQLSLPLMEKVQIQNHSFQVRQDQLILNAIANFISPNLVLFVASSRTSHEAWNILVNTYAKLSRGGLTQLKENLRLLDKDTESLITCNMQKSQLMNLLCLMFQQTMRF